MHTTLPMPTRPFEPDDVAPPSNVLSWALRSGSSARRDPGVQRLLHQAGVPLQPQAAPHQPAAPERVARRVGLQAIVDVDGRARGYELLYRDAGRLDAGGIVNGLHATCEVLATAVLDLGLPRRARGLSFFVNVDRETLMSPLVEAITPAWGVVELLETIPATADVRQRVQDLRQRGMRFALDDIDTLDDSRWALIDLVEVIKIDWQTVRPVDLPLMMARAHSHGVQVLAEKVETAGDLAAARVLGADLVQGHAIARPDVILAPGLPATSALALRRTRLLLQHGASNESVATALAMDPATALRIWQLADQDGAGAGTEDRPNVLADLVADLPRPVLQAWLSVLQVADAGVIDKSWTYAGLAQARLMKVLARRVSPTEPALAEEAFLLGLLDHYRTTLGIAYRDPDLGVRAGARLERAMRDRKGLLGAVLEFAQGQYRQPTGWLPGPLAAMPGLATALRSIYQEAHLWAKERSQNGSVLQSVADLAVRQRPARSTGASVRSLASAPPTTRRRT
ncbi:EAL and HDOD domain-containing protein [Sphaerotilus mobilis]|uniref:C-di-GMP-related signal transduction protein n=1 Tax=Sphaerotilus mobilis TaxID=47994 RepID=A0A4Q7LGR5_9BURK|nr:EAL domain-containing protein [Sphaerotilus mobilis]RZS52897.1 c-di-GMP-related signal transduction protein [Sphaerotilus mobilis]